MHWSLKGTEYSYRRDRTGDRRVGVLGVIHSPEVARQCDECYELKRIERKKKK
jgi:hypothetical protein